MADALTRSNTTRTCARSEQNSETGAYIYTKECRCGLSRIGQLDSIRAAGLIPAANRGRSNASDRRTKQPAKFGIDAPHRLCDKLRRMKATLEIYVQEGTYGFHAGTRGDIRNYAAHKTDAATAAFRAAVKHWFPSRHNNVLQYAEIRSVTVARIGEGEFRAWLKIPDAEVDRVEFRKEFTDQLEANQPRNAANPTPTNRKLGDSRRRRHKPEKSAKRKHQAGTGGKK